MWRKQALIGLGFRTRLKFGAVDNLYARFGAAQPNFCFAGHLRCRAAGRRLGKRSVRGGNSRRPLLRPRRHRHENRHRGDDHGDARFLARTARRTGSISFLLTCDEEGPAVDGTKAVLEALAAEGEKLDHCIVGEPTSEERVGDVIKNGRRGSLNVVITMDGKQGHVAYPQRAVNPVTALVEALAALKARKLDDGAPGFDPSNLEVTSVDVGNGAHNVIPQRASAKLNIRFNTNHTGEGLFAWIKETAEAAAARIGAKASFTIASQSVPFYTDPGPFTTMLVESVHESFGITPALTTTGGTSDARYIRNYAQVAELGLRNATAHMVDEHCAVEDIRTLARCYEAVLRRYFKP
jgi:succinyl-diaminopimelate desuccinylase